MKEAPHPALTSVQTSFSPRSPSQGPGCFVAEGVARGSTLPRSPAHFAASPGSLSLFSCTDPETHILSQPTVSASGYVEGACLMV